MNLNISIMTAKIKENTAEFGARVNYVNNPDPKKKAHIIASNGVLLDDNHSIIHSFEFQAEAKPSVKKPAGHLSLNFALQDKSRLTDKLMAEIADRDAAEVAKQEVKQDAESV